ncbi:MAG: glycosyl hydrolase [Candidatus Merdivicinus sp.]|jgi:hypothetical protein
MDWLNDWKNPTMRQRIKPFWFWNGDLNEEEIDRQLRMMKEQGLGGAFICARQGQKVPYLSQKWFDRIAFACQRAEEYGLEVWLYDEYPYPSGMAGGEVLLEHPEAVHTSLVRQMWDTEGGVEEEHSLGWDKILFAKAAPIDADGKADWENALDLMDCIGNRQETEIYQKSGLTSYNQKRYFTYGPCKVLTMTLPEGKWRVEVDIQQRVRDFKYYGTYFDPCHKEAVRTFLENTYERYAQTLGDKLGTSVYGMFSDETGFLGTMPWSNLLPEYFRKRFGYDLCEKLWMLHDNSAPDAAKVRYQYCEALHELFRESYHHQISDWCAEHNILYATEVPSMRRSTQLYSHVVGGDTSHEKVGRTLDWVYDEYLVHYRSCAPGISSLARQLNRDYAMVESFHSLGWSMTLQDAKWMFDLMASQGINFFNVHAFYYTIDGITKHDAPPSQFFQNPYWKNYHLTADYAGRLSAWVSHTEAMHDIAILDPELSFWVRQKYAMGRFAYTGEDEWEKDRLFQLCWDWINVMKELAHAQVGYDLIDGEILKMAKVENGRLKIGKASYAAILLPPGDVIEEETTRKLQEFVRQGGTLLAFGLLPSRIIDDDTNVRAEYLEIFGAEEDADQNYWTPDRDRTQVYRKGNNVFLSGGPEEATAEIVRRFPQEITVDAGGNREIYSSLRTSKDGRERYVLVGNHGRLPAKVILRWKTEGIHWIRMNLENGQQTRLADTERNEMVLELDGCESILLRMTAEGSDLPVEPVLPVVWLDLSKPMKVSAVGLNVFRLEKWQVSLDKKVWKDTEPRIFMELCSEQQLLNHDNLSYRGGFGLPKRIQVEYPIPIWYRREFTVEELPSQMLLLMDRKAIGGQASICINGVEIPMQDFVPRFINDQNNLVCPILAHIRQGVNQIEVQVQIEKDSDGISDPLYLLGDFGVKDEIIGRKPETALLRSGGVAGYPYYSGDLVFETDQPLDTPEEAEEVLLKPDPLEDFYECLQLKINGHDLGTRAFTPYGFLCRREWLKPVNHLEWTYTNTLIQMLEGSIFDYSQHQVKKL